MTAAGFSGLVLTGGSATATGSTVLASLAEGGVAATAVLAADLREGRFVEAGEEAMSAFVSRDFEVVR